MTSRGRMGVDASMVGDQLPRPGPFRAGESRAKSRRVKLEFVRVIDEDGKVVHPEREPHLPGDEHRRIFRTMLLLRNLDERMLRLQRQGRLGFRSEERRVGKEWRAGGGRA